MQPIVISDLKSWAENKPFVAEISLSPCVLSHAPQRPFSALRLEARLKISSRPRLSARNRSCAASPQLLRLGDLPPAYHRDSDGNRLEVRRQIIGLIDNIPSRNEPSGAVSNQMHS